MCNGIIYKTICLVNGKIYIGKTIKSLRKRKNQHERHSLNSKLNYYFYRALRKYGWDNFEWEIIDTVDNEQELNLLEQLYIEEYRRKGQVYNLNDGRGGISGFKFSEESKRKMSEARKGRIPWNKGRKGHKHTEEARKKMSAAQKGRIFTVEHKRKLSEAKKGHNPSEETRAKMAEAHKNISIETRERMSEALKGRIFTEEHKRKISEAGKGRKHSDETRLKMSLAHKGKILTIEHKSKLSESQRIRRERELRCA